MEPSSTGPQRARDALSPHGRAADLEALRSGSFDVVVVGGGVVGCGAALDAASRGLRVALVEADDFASGTSSKSSKLIHGGLRYLEMLDFGLVREALRERRRLLTVLAPHLVRPVEFVWPLTHRVWERGYLGTGLALYDTMGGAGAVPVHRQLSRRRLRRDSPGLDPAAYVGGVSFHDAIEDDARMVATIARTARGLGAAVVNGVRALGPVRTGGRVTGLRVREPGAGEFVVRTKHVAFAAGVWSDELGGALTVRPSKGVHLMVDRELIDSRAGVLMRTEKSVLFVIPWGRHWMIGDTDTDWTHDRATPVASGADVDYLLRKVNTLLARKLSRDDVVGVFAGLRPLVRSDPDADTTKLSREHSVVSGGRDVTMVAGGKFTTYRVMAQDLIDAAVTESGLAALPSRTREIPLVGAAGYAARAASASAIAREHGLSEVTVSHLLGRYGDRVDDLLALPALLKEIPGHAPYLWAEVVYACTHEGARSVADVLERRTRIRVQYRDAGLDVAGEAAELMAPVLGWSAQERDASVERYRRVVRAERAALSAGSDDEAVAAYEEALRS